MRNYVELLNDSKTDSIIILGTGTSLNDIDVTCFGNTDIISVNASILKLNKVIKAKYWLSSDPQCRKWSYYDDVKSHGCKLILRDTWKTYLKDTSNTYLFTTRRLSKEDLLNTSNKELCGCSSVPGAIDFAIQAGYKNLFLFGLDHYFLGSNRYFWQLWEKKKQPRFLGTMATTHHQQRIFTQNNLAYEFLSYFSKSVGASIFNCNIRSKIENFEKIDIEEFSKKVNNDKR